MPDDCRVSIRRLTAGPPFQGGTDPIYLNAWGRVSRNCAKVEVELLIPVPGTPGMPLFAPSNAMLTLPPVPSGAAASDPAYDAYWQARFVRDPLSGPPIACGDSLFVRATCAEAGHEGCMAEGNHALYCGHFSPADAEEETDDGPARNPLKLMCIFSLRVYTLALLTGLALLIAGIPFPGLIVAAVASLALAGIAWLALKLLCQMARCPLMRATCWACKWAVVFGIGITLFSVSLGAGWVTALVGGVVSLTIMSIRRSGCSVPALSTPPF